MPAVVKGGAWNIRTSANTAADLEVLKHHVNADYMIPIALDASSVAPDTDGVRRLKAGTLLTKNAAGQYMRYQGAGSGSAANEVQTVTVNGAPTGGTFTLGINGVNTDPIAYNASAADVEAALVATGQVRDADVTVGKASNVYTITFSGELAGQNVPTLTQTSALTGGTTPSVAVGTTTQGTEGAQTILGVLATTHEFPDNLTHADAQSQMWNHGQVFRADRIVDWATYGSAARTALPTCRFD